MIFSGEIAGFIRSITNRPQDSFNRSPDEFNVPITAFLKNIFPSLQG
jgi:hypothetical protein